MKSDGYKYCAALLTAALAGGCAGNGDGLNQSGQPIGSGGTSSGPITADFESIQENVFTPICSVCHIGAGAPEGLQLDAAHSYNLLVGVPSAEMPSLLRVKPGDPTDSYIVHKIKGPPGIVGGQMPLNEKPLDQATMDAIMQWISNGAPNAPAASAAAAQVFAVQTTAPLNGATVKAPLARILVTFTQDVDASLVNGTTVTLERMAGAAPMASAAPMAGAAPESVATGAAQKISAAGALAEMNAAVLLITPTTALGSGVYRVTVRGTGGGALANMNAATLGSDTSFEFTVEPAQ
jgi:hypothetical protein